MSRRSAQTQSSRPRPSKKKASGAYNHHRTEPVPVAVEFGRRISQMRHDRKITFDAFVEELEMGRGYVSELERGLVVPSLIAITKIATILEVSPADLVAGDSPRELMFKLALRLPDAEVRKLLVDVRARADLTSDVLPVVRVPAAKPKRSGPRTG